MSSSSSLSRMWSQRSMNKTTRPAHHANSAGTSFQNPWPSANTPTWAEFAGNSFPLSWYSGNSGGNEQVQDIKVVKPDWGTSNATNQGLQKGEYITGTWLGHAGVLVELPLVGTTDTKTCWLLFDPMFSMRAGPTAYTGPQRFRPNPCEITDLPGCDAVFISHNHYDHLDFSTIKALNKRFPNSKYFVPLGNRNWMIGAGIPKELIFELDWWQRREFSPLDLGHESSSEAEEDTLIRFTCVPAQHNSGRTGVDSGSTLWCGWTVEQLLYSKDEAEVSKVTRKGAIYHAGDTGYRRTARSDVTCPVFKEIGEKLGPFDLSFVPIWRGGSLSFVSYFGVRVSSDDIPAMHHVSPADAAEIHKDVKSKNSVAIHFGTFVGSENESRQAVTEFTVACQNKDVAKLDEQKTENGRAGCIDIGASIVVPITKEVIDA